MVNQTRFPDLLQIYSNVISIDYDKIPKEYMSGFTYKPNITITNAAGDNTGRNMQIDNIYTVDGRILGFNIVNSGLYYTDIPTITIVNGGKSDNNYVIPPEFITMTGSIGVKHVFTASELLEYSNPLQYKNIPIVDNTIYTELPSVRVATGSGASATVNLIGDTVSSITLTSGGSNYINPPTVEFIDEFGIDAVGVASIIDGKVTNIDITNPGSKYTSNTLVNFSNLGSGVLFEVLLENWTYNIGSDINPYLDNHGGYVYNYEDTFTDVTLVSDTVNYPQYLQIKSSETAQI